MSAVTVDESVGLATGAGVRPKTAGAGRPVLARAHAGIDLAAVVRSAPRPLGRFPLADLVPACRWAATATIAAAALMCARALLTGGEVPAGVRSVAAAAQGPAASLFIAAGASAPIAALIALAGWSRANGRHRGRCLRTVTDITAATTPVTVIAGPGERGSALVWLDQDTRLSVPAGLVWAVQRSPNQLPTSIRCWVAGLPPAVRYLVATTDQATRDLHEQVWACVELLEGPVGAAQVGLGGSGTGIAARCAHIDQVINDLRRGSRDARPDDQVRGLRAGRTGEHR